MASLNTRIPGDPESIREAARWLRSLGKAVSHSADQTKQVVEESAHTWRDSKADEYRERWDSGGRNAAKLADQIELYANAYNKCADNLQTAQGHMRQARELSTGPPYLEMSGDLILFPERGAFIPGVPDSDAGADEQFEQRILAYREAEGLVHKAYGLISETLAHLGEPPERPDLPGFFTAADYVNAGRGALAKAYERSILAKGEQTAANRRVWAGAFRGKGALDLAGWIDELADEDLARAREAAKPYTAIGKTVDLTGKVILGVGVGYDIAVNGEPWDKALLEGASSYAGGIVGAAGGAGTGAWLGSATGPLAVVAVPVLGVGGMVAGGMYGSAKGGQYGTELYEKLEGRTVIDDPDYFK